MSQEPDLWSRDGSQVAEIKLKRQKFASGTLALLLLLTLWSFTVLGITEVYARTTFTILVAYRPTLTLPPPYACGLTATGAAAAPCPTVWFR